MLVVGAVAAYLIVLVGLGGQPAWDRLGVPDIQPNFADMRSVTSAWECDRQGTQVLPSNPCDPWGRPANYPTAWLWPSALGLGQEVTAPLGVATGVIFFVSFLVLIGAPGLREALLYSAVAISPTVMLGVERANADLLLFALVVAAIHVFRRGSAGRLVAYVLLLVAAVLKLYPALAWGVLLRQSRRLALISGGVIVGLFATYVVATFDTIRVISEVVSQIVPVQYGADVGIDSLQSWAADKAGLSWLAETGDWLTAVTLAAGVAAIAGIAWRRRSLGEVVRRSIDVHTDAFVAGAGIYVFSFILWHNWDYRLIFLLMTLPQLVVWTRASQSPVPVPRLTLVALLGTLWLSVPLTVDLGFWNPALDFITLDDLGLSLDEVLNWVLFVSLGVGLLLATVPLAIGRFRDRAEGSDRDDQRLGAARVPTPEGGAR